MLEQSLAAGFSVLTAGGSSIDAVIAAIVVMEDSPLFNAGKGAVFSNAGRIELDASIMDGSTLMAGSVAGVTTIRNPIRAAHAVMTQSEHVMLIGQGAEAFAAEKGLEIVDPSYFHTQFRWDQLQKAIAQERLLRDHDALSDEPDGGRKNGSKTRNGGRRGAGYARQSRRRHLDWRHYEQALWARRGLADHRRRNLCGQSFRCGICHRQRRNVYSYLCRFQHSGTGTVAAQPLIEAADNTLKEVAAIAGDGGLIVLDAKGNYAMRFNTKGMFRGTIGSDGIARVEIFE